ncbi:MAG: hypothetical protein MPI95_06690 [Nitrosopumilus sp.]|nr:hypothetical protein [Nitrosopumilus sp.]CAI9831577.1 conserved hypothetical protein [Nitrosopumilaceae archaeon]MDA7941544.1 hypothetical protein [Nitrosopumilus sp.]MDA7943603.1 hypothetical protein [Nitrosopumilus sp.]MDA7945596.1 hypothetical protein [Nitrosopumilus sp.]
MQACRILLDLEMPAARARALLAALGPDNTGIPDGMTISVDAGDGGLRIELAGDNMLQLASTADEMLGHAQAALGAIRE